MKRPLFYIICSCMCLIIQAQDVFHVFPKDHQITPGKASGNGTLEHPWDLQTALSQTSEVVNSGDTIWLHKGLYNGRFISTLESLKPNSFITVSAFENDKVILNGNVKSDRNTVLEVKGKHVIYKNFEITWLGNFSRDENEANFQVCSGIRHLTGVNCRFYNLKIHDNPGLGIGSWKHGAGTSIERCMIYNNGFMSKDGKGRGEGIYVQNNSEAIRIIKNNIIYNNYYKGIEVWSAGKNAKTQYVKNITLDRNILFNNGSPSGAFRDNIIIASDDNNGINIAHHISVLNNILYHNTVQENGNLIGDAPSLTLGFNKRAPIEDVIVDGNIITGGYNGLRILQAKSLQFTNNIVYTGIVNLSPTLSNYVQDWNFNSNTIYTKRKAPFRIPKVKDHSLESWQETFQIDSESKVKSIAEFKLDPVLYKSYNTEQPNSYHVALFSAEGHDVVVDFSESHVEPLMTFTIYDVENPNVVLKSGTLSEDYKITIPMHSTAIEKPLHNAIAKKTLSNFGVFIIEFETSKPEENTTKVKQNAFKRFFRWLGF